ncbi:hypothetical protein GCM10020255_111100 [Rhodococcus baikonurensis]
MTRTVLVTGGGTGIGRAVAAAFARDGDTVFVTGRRTETLEKTAEELGDAVHALTCDNSDPKDLKRLQDSLPGTIDVVVHCAAVTRTSIAKRRRIWNPWPPGGVPIWTPTSSPRC